MNAVLLFGCTLIRLIGNVLAESKQRRTEQTIKAQMKICMLLQYIVIFSRPAFVFCFFLIAAIMYLNCDMYRTVGYTLGCNLTTKQI